MPVSRADGDSKGERKRMTVFGSNSAERLATVILATDFSEASDKAARYASALARRMQSALVITHAFVLDQAALEAETFRHLMSQQRIHLQQELNKLAGDLTSGRGVVETVLLEHDPRIAVPELAERRKPSIIVMGTHGGGLFERFVVGSTAEGILRHTRLPALTVGPKTPPLSADWQVRRVLFVTNNTAGAAETAQLAVDVASAFGATLDVLNVIHPKSVEDTLNEPHELLAHHDETEAALPAYFCDHLEIRTFVSVGQPRTEILKHIREREIDLLVMCLNAETQLEMQGNLSGAFPIIAEAACPVMTQVAITPASEAAGD